MRHDPYVIRNWAALIPILDEAGLEAMFMPAEDESVDDAIEIRPAGAGEDSDIGDIQICSDGFFMAVNWTSPSHQARRSGGETRDVVKALKDLLANLRRDGMIP